MGMACEINTILKLGEDYPASLVVGSKHRAVKSGYRIFAMDVPLQLVNGDWVALADVAIVDLRWRGEVTEVVYEVRRVYEVGWRVK
jgi:Protein of unknown function (DUF2584)